MRTYRTFRTRFVTLVCSGSSGLGVGAEASAAYCIVVIVPLLPMGVDVTVPL